MKIDLNEKIGEHFKRLEGLAKEASEDEEQSYSSRASAMTALSGMLRELTKTQESIINMERLMIIEATVIETVRDHLTSDQQQQFVDLLAVRLEK